MASYRPTATVVVACSSQGRPAAVAPARMAAGPTGPTGPPPTATDECGMKPVRARPAAQRTSPGQPRSIWQGVVVLAGGRSLYTVGLVGPGAKIHPPAALTAEGARQVVRAEQRRAPAGGAGHAAGGGGRRGRGRGDGLHQAHRVSSRGMSTGAGRNRPSPSACISRTDTSSRWPVISGTRCLPGSSRKRSNW